MVRLVEDDDEGQTLEFKPAEEHPSSLVSRPRHPSLCNRRLWRCRRSRPTSRGGAAYGHHRGSAYPIELRTVHRGIDMVVEVDSPELIEAVQVLGVVAVRHGQGWPLRRYVARRHTGPVATNTLFKGMR